MILGVDVDLTFVDTGKAWYEHLRSLSGLSVPPFEEVELPLDYDLTKVFHDIDFQRSLDYWRGEQVYDELEPFPNAVETLRRLKEEKGYEIVFVSTIKGNHHKSKFNMVKKFCPFLDGFIATKEKKYAGVHAMIDDRLDVLERMSKNRICVQFASRYTQKTDFKPHYVANDWKEVYNIFSTNY